MFIRNLNLLYNSDPEPLGGGEGGEPQEPVAEPAEPQEPTGGNPAWDDIRALVDPDTFSRLQPKFEEWDKGVQKRFESISEKYKPYEQLLNGRQPEYLQHAVAYADWLDRSPQEVYERLGEYLSQQGIQIPAGQQQAQATEPDPGTHSEGDIEDDPRLVELQKQQQQILESMQQQRQQQLQMQAQAQLDAEVKQLREKHKELDDDDMREIYQRMALATQRAQTIPGAKLPTLEEAYQEYSAYVNRIQNKPRPGDSAPQLVPPGGGASSSQQQKPWGELPRADVQDAVAALLRQNRGG